MTQHLNVVAVTGGLQKPSRTRALVEAIGAEFAARRQIDLTLIDLSDLLPSLGSTVSRAGASLPVETSLRAIENADLLIVGTPVYRGAYTGLFKHLFDLVDHNALFDLPVLLAASGGSARHALVIEQSLRPLFSFFQALTLPIGVYATDAEFTNHRISDAGLTDRIRLAVDRALPVVTALPRSIRQPELARAA